MRSKRGDALAQRPVNRETFIRPWPEVGLSAMESPFDPRPSLQIVDGLAHPHAIAHRSGGTTRAGDVGIAGNKEPRSGVLRGSYLSQATCRTMVSICFSLTGA